MGGAGRGAGHRPSASGRPLWRSPVSTCLPRPEPGRPRVAPRALLRQSPCFLFPFRRGGSAPPHSCTPGSRATDGSLAAHLIQGAPLSAPQRHSLVQPILLTAQYPPGGAPGAGDAATDTRQKRRPPCVEPTPGCGPSALSTLSFHFCCSRGRGSLSSPPPRPGTGRSGSLP